MAEFPERCSLNLSAKCLCVSPILVGFLPQEPTINLKRLSIMNKYVFFNVFVILCSYIWYYKWKCNNYFRFMISFSILVLCKHDEKSNNCGIVLQSKYTWSLSKCNYTSFSCAMIANGKQLWTPALMHRFFPHALM